MAGIKAPIQDILTKLSTIQVTNGDGNTVSLYSRIWNNQIEAEKAGETYAYPKPAAFVEVVSPAIFEEIGQNFRSADIGISIHLVHEYYNQDGTFEQDLEVFDLRDKVIEALSQYKPTGCGQLVSTGEQQDYDHDNIYHYVISFVCNFIDSKGSPYDPSRGLYVDKQPPTDLQVNVTDADTPIFSPIPQPYKIPQ
ncbi:MAG: hypothetical protein WCH59_09265 [Chitinophagia bacterium]|jgi:hypothetical protein